MRFRFLKTATLIAALTALFAVPLLLQHDRAVQAQGYSGALPNVSATGATGLGLTYTAGTVTQGGAQQAITGNTLTAADNQTSCAAPAFTACNFVYWTSGTSLSITQTAATAFGVGNVVVAYVTSSGGNISVVTPASWSPANSVIGQAPTGVTNTAATYWIPPGNCYYSTSGGTFAAQTGVGVTGNTGLGLVNAGATPPGTPVMQVATTNAGTATNTISCLMNPPSTIAVTGRGFSVSSVTAYYGVQQTGLGTQATVGASGTMNGVAVFGKIVMPAAAGSETPSTVAQARADSGTTTFTPAAASMNVATTTAGAFYSQTIAPGAAFTIAAADLTQYYVNITFLATATSATTINLAGVQVRGSY